MWSFMMPETLYNFICKEDNFKTLNKLKLKFHETNEIIKIFLEDDSSQFNVLRNYLIKHSRSYQFIYANLFPRYFARIDDYGIQSKTNFNIFYKNYINQKNIFDWHQNSLLATIPDDMESVQPSTPLKMNELNDENVDFEKLKQIKEKVEEVDGGSTSKEIIIKKKKAEKKRQKRQGKKNNSKKNKLKTHKKLKKEKKRK